ncbi:hypothetical protein D3C76_429820 [compost metagenome]
MIYYVAVVTVIFLMRFTYGWERMSRPPKTFIVYNHKADVVEMILNMLIGVFGLALWVGHILKLV